MISLDAKLGLFPARFRDDVFAISPYIHIMPYRYSAAASAFEGDARSTPIGFIFTPIRFQRTTRAYFPLRLIFCDDGPFR